MIRFENNGSEIGHLMPDLTFEQKKKRVRELLAQDSALNNIIGMTKPNDAPSYDGDKLVAESGKTVEARVGKYANVARDIAAGKKFIRQ
ncbi:MAG: hypothetical protein AAFO93_14715 [Pseudomonadota bacterium]